MGVGFDIVNDHWRDRCGFAPFGLEKEEAARAGEGCPLLGPVEVGFVEDDHFELVCQGGDRRERCFELLWGEADPVPLAA